MRTSINMQARRIAGLLACTVSILFLFASTAVAEEDHLEGYKIKDLNQVPSTFPTGVPITNQFGNDNCVLKKPQFYLVPSEKNGGDDARGGPAGEFICYKAKCTSFPPTTERESQFGLHSIEIKKAKLICLPVVPPPPPCTLVGGFCWFLGSLGDSCDATCAGLSLTCDSATVSYAGAPSGTLTNCDAVLDALLGPGTAADNPSGNLGCSAALGNVPTRFMGTPTTCAAADAFVARACACQ